MSLFRLTENDIAASLALSDEAGWNQTADDWRVFIARGRTMGMRRHRSLVATAATLPYGEIGFVAMVLTSSPWRQQGFATRLLGSVIDYLGQDGCVPVLDATAAGRPVYQRQGFIVVDDLHRWEGSATGTKHPEPACQDSLGELDTRAFGARRTFLFADILSRPGTCVVTGEGGFAMARAGRRAIQIGPVIAADEMAAIALLERLFDRVHGPIVLDVPTRWELIGDWLVQHGLHQQRSFSRMVRHGAKNLGDPGRYFASAGPEFG